MSESPTDPETYALIGAAMEVHRELGYGFLEAIYQESLAKEFARRAIPFEQEKRLTVAYKSEELDARYRVDFVCYGTIILELKALSRWSGTEEAQLLNYLKASKLRRGHLINFGKPSLDYKRLVFGYEDEEIKPGKESSTDFRDFHRFGLDRR